MRQPWQLRQGARPSDGLSRDVCAQSSPADLLAHPALEKRFGGGPEVEVRVEIAAQTLDIEKRLLQQHQLRLDLDLELARGLEQAQQHPTKRDFLERAVEDRLATSADGRLELVDAGTGWHPASVDVGLRHPPVVAPEERQEIAGEVVLVDIRQGAHDAEIQRDIGAVVGDHDVARMHVGVKKPVAKHLGEEDLDTLTRQTRDVDALLAQGRDLADRRAAHALHDDDVALAPVPVDLGDAQQARLLEIAPQLAGVGGLEHEVELLRDRFLELRHHLTRLEPLAVAVDALDQRGDDVHERHIAGDDAGNAGPQDLDRHLTAIGQNGEVHLRHRGAGHRFPLETGEHFAERTLVGALQHIHRLVGWEGRDTVLQ